MHVNRAFPMLLCRLLTPAAFLLGGCQEEDDPLTRDEFCDQWANAVCVAEVVSVCQVRESECEMSQAAGCRDWLPADFQDVGVDACLDAVRRAYSDADLDAAELDIVWRLDAPCSGIILAGEGGDSCERDADCSGSAGLTCVFKDAASGSCERATEVQAGFSCSEPEEACEEGFYCNGDNCIVTLELGEACHNDTQCSEGLFCVDQQCEAQLPVGADCTTDRECESEICYEVDADERVCVDRIRLSPAEPACDTLR